ncbi:MAG: L,D-transpeptidase family protein [Anaerolineae bacterium]|jgi:lipoprotein-anchoring transpeptidase ErfK/SrfK
MPKQDRRESLTILLSLLLIIVIIFALAPVVLVWLAGSPAQAAPAKTPFPTPTAYVAPVTPEPTGEIPTASPLPPTPTPNPSITVMASDGANVRSGPGTVFEAVGYLAAGEQAKVLGRYADWWQIDYAGQPAWIYGPIVAALDVEGVPEVVPPPTPVPPAPPIIPPPAEPGEIDEEHWIDVDLSEQTLTAYENGVAVRTTLVSTGLPATPTPTGQFRIWIKFRYDDMSGEGYYIEDVPYVMYFYKGYGLHGVTWHGNFGHPMSHGCINLPTEEAEWLFGWADVGTLVNIHE